MNDFTEGTIWKKLIIFAIPLLLSSLVQQLYNTVDLIFIGNFLGTEASSAIGASSLLITCLVGFFGGMSVSSGVVVSHEYGAGDKLKLKAAIHNSVALSLVGGALLMGIGYFFAPVYLKLVNTPLYLQEAAEGYLRIYFLSFIPIVTYNICSGVIRALGDSKTPLYAQLWGGIANVLMDALFLMIFKNGINGVAWATLISQSIAAALIVYKLTKLDRRYSLRFKDIRFDSELSKKVIGIGVPAGTQSLVITLSNVMAQYHINSISVAAIAAFTAYFKVELVIYLPIVAIGQATMIFVGQNMGAKNFERATECTKYCLLVGLSISVIMSALALVFGEQLFRVFAKDHEVIKLGLNIIHITFPFYFIYVILQVLGDSLRGLGMAKPPMYIIMLNICIIRTGLLFLIVPHFLDVRGVAVTYPLTWALTAVCMSIYYMNYKKKFLMGKTGIATRTE
ncbi:MAG: MATE family efflux transporter [Thermotaleaceae bacterium]